MGRDMSARMLVAVGWGNSFGSWTMSKVSSSKVTSGGMVFILMSGGVAAAMIGVPNTAIYSSIEQLF